MNEPALTLTFSPTPGTPPPVTNPPSAQTTFVSTSESAPLTPTTRPAQVTTNSELNNLHPVSQTNVHIPATSAAGVLENVPQYPSVLDTKVNVANESLDSISHRPTDIVPTGDGFSGDTLGQFNVPVVSKPNILPLHIPSVLERQLNSHNIYNSTADQVFNQRTPEGYVESYPGANVDGLTQGHMTDLSRFESSLNPSLDNFGQLQDVTGNQMNGFGQYHLPANEGFGQLSGSPMDSFGSIHSGTGTEGLNQHSFSNVESAVQPEQHVKTNSNGNSPAYKEGFGLLPEKALNTSELITGTMLQTLDNNHNLQFGESEKSSTMNINNLLNSQNLKTDFVTKSTDNVTSDLVPISGTSVDTVGHESVSLPANFESSSNAFLQEQTTLPTSGFAHDLYLPTDSVGQHTESFAQNHSLPEKSSPTPVDELQKQHVPNQGGFDQQENKTADRFNANGPVDSFQSISGQPLDGFASTETLGKQIMSPNESVQPHAVLQNKGSGQYPLNINEGFGQPKGLEGNDRHSQVPNEGFGQHPLDPNDAFGQPPVLPNEGFTNENLSPNYLGQNEGFGQQTIGQDKGTGQLNVGLNEGTGQPHMGQNEGFEQTHTGINEGFGQPQTGPNEGTGQPHISPNNGTGKQHIDPNEGFGQTHIGLNEGFGQPQIGPTEGTEQPHISPNNATDKQHIGPNEGFGQPHIGPNEGFGQQHIGPNEGFGQQSMSTNEGFGQHVLGSKEGFVQHSFTTNEGLGQHPMASNGGFDQLPFAPNEGIDQHQLAPNEGFGQHPLAPKSGLELHPFDPNAAIGQHLLDKNSGLSQHPLTTNNGIGQRQLGPNAGFDQHPLSSNEGFGQHPLAPNDGIGQHSMDPTAGFDPHTLTPNDGFGQHLLDPNAGFVQHPLTPNAGFEPHSLTPNNGIVEHPMDPNAGFEQNHLTPSDGIGQHPFATNEGFAQPPLAPNEGFGQHPLVPKEGIEQHPMDPNAGFNQHPMGANEGFGQHTVPPNNVFVDHSMSQGLDQHAIDPSGGFSDHPVTPTDGFGVHPGTPNDAFGQHPVEPVDSFGQHPVASSEGFGPHSVRPTDVFGQHPLSSVDGFGQHLNSPNNGFGHGIDTSLGNFGQHPYTPIDGMEHTTEATSTTSDFGIDVTSAPAKTDSTSPSTLINSMTNQASSNILSGSNFNQALHGNTNLPIPLVRERPPTVLSRNQGNSTSTPKSPLISPQNLLNTFRNVDIPNGFVGPLLQTHTLQSSGTENDLPRQGINLERGKLLMHRFMQGLNSNPSFVNGSNVNVIHLKPDLLAKNRGIDTGVSQTTVVPLNDILTNITDALSTLMTIKDSVFNKSIESNKTVSKSDIVSPVPTNSVHEKDIKLPTTVPPIVSKVISVSTSRPNSSSLIHKWRQEIIGMIKAMSNETSSTTKATDVDSTTIKGNGQPADDPHKEHRQFSENRPRPKMNVMSEPGQSAQVQVIVTTGQWKHCVAWCHVYSLCVVLQPETSAGARCIACNVMYCMSSNQMLPERTSNL